MQKNIASFIFLCYAVLRMNLGRLFPCRSIPIYGPSIYIIARLLGPEKIEIDFPKINTEP